jgi:phosphate transport system substrate-binding protein
MFTNGWPKGTVADFINYVLSSKGQEIVKKEGYIPLY